MATNARSTSPTIPQRFATAHNKGDLHAAVQLARTVFSDNLFAGNLEDDPISLASHLAGDHEPPPLTADAQDQYSADMYAALAMGIAIGQLVHPDVFAKGGRS